MPGQSRVANMTLQYVSGGDANGNPVRLSNLIAQTVELGGAPGLRVSAMTLQPVYSGEPKGARIGQLVAQVVSQNLADSGGVFRVSKDELQVVYTIGTPDTAAQRAWTFDFDGHTFYVLDLADEGALVYDLTTQSWSQWDTAGFEGHFNFKNGFHWRDGKSVIGGGILDGQVGRIEEEQYLDEGFRPIAYEIQGVVFSSSEQYLRQFNLRMVGSPGRRGLEDDVEPPTLSMAYSDDNGATWSTTQTVTLTSDKEQRIQFRSLGAFRQPGRIFRLFDSGGIKFVAYVMADVEGE